MRKKREVIVLRCPHCGYKEELGKGKASSNFTLVIRSVTDNYYWFKNMEGSIHTVIKDVVELKFEYAVKCSMCKGTFRIKSTNELVEGGVSP
ncbi:MAG: hypothetical protein GXN96_00775 [Aquificae bacterium]|nr:hypothetical protein [Aquificota bacterium]